MKESLSNQNKTVSRVSGNESVFQQKSVQKAQLKARPIQKRENNTGLPNNLKAGIENLSGYSMNDVKVHRNSDKPAQLQAHGYAKGTDIYLGAGQEEHLAHEAWHVIQQKQGRVKPTLQMKKDITINNDSSLEEEANIMGAKAMEASSQYVGMQREETSKGTLQEKKSDGNVMQLYKQYANEGETNSKNIVHWQSNGTPLRVAEDGTAAMAQAGASGGQELYVANFRLASINSGLTKVSAPFGIMPKGGKTVEGASPSNLEEAKKILIPVKPVEPNDHSKTKEIPDDCGEAAKTVTGALAEDTILIGEYNDSEGKVKNTSSSLPRMMKYEIMIEHFGAKIKDNAKIIEEIVPLIELDNILNDQLRPIFQRALVILKEVDKLLVINAQEIKNGNAEQLKIRIELDAIPENDPKRAEKRRAIKKSIEDLWDAHDASTAVLKSLEENYRQQLKDMESEVIDNRIVIDILNDYKENFAEIEKLSSIIMKPYNDQSAGDKEIFDEKVGINRYSNPNVGDAYTISSGGAKFEGENVWNYHWGGVIFKSTTGSDNITMENYKGNKPYDWRFQMYGVPTKGNSRMNQTFHENHKATKQHGDNPITLTGVKK